jgi:hypothetical protein
LPKPGFILLTLFWNKLSLFTGAAIIYIKLLFMGIQKYPGGSLTNSGQSKQVTIGDLPGEEDPLLKILA